MLKLILTLTLKSIWARKLSSLLCLLSISFSLVLILSLEKTRQGARESFTSTVSGADLLVGARTGEIQLLLYSLFHMGEATNNIRYQSYKQIKSWPQVAWTIPFSLGDSFRGHRVVGTTIDFFTHFRYGRQESLSFNKGHAFGQDLFEVVLGSRVADTQNLNLGDQIIIAHGMHATRETLHDHLPFKVVGILAPTTTPIDQGVYVSLEAIEAIHIGWEGGIPNPDKLITSRDQLAENIQISQITSFLLGARTRVQALGLRSQIAQFRDEPLMAIIPGLSLARLWETIGQMEGILLFMSWFALFIGLNGLLIALLTSLHQRTPEMAILRSIGASPLFISALLMLEAFLLVLGGSLLGHLFLVILAGVALPPIEAKLLISLPIRAFEWSDLRYLLITLGLSQILALIPALRAYSQAQKLSAF